MDKYVSHKFTQMKHQKFCIYSDEEPETLRKQSCFDGSFLMSSNNLMADHTSVSINGDKSALHKDAYCFEQDCFGDEEAGADMIGRLCHRLTEFLLFITI